MRKSNHPHQKMIRNILIYCDREHKRKKLKDLALDYGCSTTRIHQIHSKVRRLMLYFYHTDKQNLIIQLDKLEKIK